VSVRDEIGPAKTAFVFAGGGSFGAIQVGMLHSLAAHGVAADMVVGSSVGALNGAFYAGDPTLDGVQRLAAIWRSLTRHDVFPMSWRTVLSFLWRRDFLIPHDGIRKLIEDHIPYRNLEEAKLPVHIVTTEHRLWRQRGVVGRLHGGGDRCVDGDPGRVLADPLQGLLSRRRRDLQQHAGPGRREEGRQAPDRSADRARLREPGAAGRGARQRAARADATDWSASSKRLDPISSISWCRRCAPWWAHPTISREPPIISTAPFSPPTPGWPSTACSRARSRTRCGCTVTERRTPGGYAALQKRQVY
jgi:hypothetical protein